MTSSAVMDDGSNVTVNASHVTADSAPTGQTYVRWYPEGVLLQVALACTLLILTAFASFWSLLCYLYHTSRLDVTGHNRYLIGSSMFQFFGILLLAGTPEVGLASTGGATILCTQCAFVFGQCFLMTYAIYLEMALLRERFLYIARPLHYNKYDQLNQSKVIICVGAVLSALPLAVIFVLPSRFRVVYLSWTLACALAAGLLTNVTFTAVVFRIGCRHIDWDIQVYRARDVSRLKNPGATVLGTRSNKVHPNTCCLQRVRRQSTTAPPPPQPPPAPPPTPKLRLDQANSGQLGAHPTPHFESFIAEIQFPNCSGHYSRPAIADDVTDGWIFGGTADAGNEYCAPGGEQGKESVSARTIFVRSVIGVLQSPPGGEPDAELATGSDSGDSLKGRSLKCASTTIPAGDCSPHNARTSSTPIPGMFPVGSDHADVKIHSSVVDRSTQTDNDDVIKSKPDHVLLILRHYTAKALRLKSIVAVKAATYVILYVLKFLLVGGTVVNHLSATSWSVQKMAIWSALNWSLLGSLQLIWICYTDRDIKHAIIVFWRDWKCCRSAKILPDPDKELTISVIS